VILDPHLESDQYQNLSTSKGSTLGHNLQTLVDINEHIYELPCEQTDRQTHIKVITTPVSPAQVDRCTGKHIITQSKSCLQLRKMDKI